MGITASLAADLRGITALTAKDEAQLHTLILDYFAAAYAGFRQNEAFNRAVERAVLPQGGAAESTVFLQRGNTPPVWRRS